MLKDCTKTQQGLHHHQNCSDKLPWLDPTDFIGPDGGVDKSTPKISSKPLYNHLHTQFPSCFSNQPEDSVMLLTSTQET
jgi:hypothetical protein